jgi:hypothetical protein
MVPTRLPMPMLPHYPPQPQSQQPQQQRVRCHQSALLQFHLPNQSHRNRYQLPLPSLLLQVQACWRPRRSQPHPQHQD